jgi:hypothetical protein
VELPDVHLNSAHDLAYPSSLSLEDIAYLSGLFVDQIESVEEFVGRPIPSWWARQSIPHHHRDADRAGATGSNA